MCPTGFSSFDAAERIAELLRAEGFDPEASPCVATGYGRVAVPFADKVVTEITCTAAARATCSATRAPWWTWAGRTRRSSCCAGARWRSSR
ncbi:hypothetical protein [Eggerthella sinensis]|uniref:hypothetical protein n=1 Tax=Eggerthella sinensis TaxID=242230 RepID=UPI0022E58322|nr:hypothetical protein [Eggerthella sinensis]